MESYYFIHRWRPQRISYFLYIEKELQTLHRSFEDRSKRELFLLPERKNSLKVDRNVTRSLENVNKDYAICQEFASTQRKIKLTVQVAELRSNHLVQVNKKFFSNNLGILMVNRATHFCAASFVCN